MIYTENVVNFVLQDEVDDVRRYLSIYDRVWEMTLGRDESAEVIRKAMGRLRR